MRTELRPLLALAAPLALGHLGQQLIGTVGMGVVGRLGEAPLGAAGLGNSLFFGATILGLGILLGLDPIMAQAVGGGDRDEAHRGFWQGVWIAAGVTIPLSLVILAAVALLTRSEIDPTTARLTAAYVYARLPSLLPFLLTVAARSYLQSHGITRPWLVAVIVANALNVPVSLVLVLGDAGLARLGLPGTGLTGLGTAGAGLAATLATTLQAAIVLLGVRAATRGAPATSRRPDRQLIRRTLRLGVPLGLALLVEVGVFSVVTVLMGYVGSTALASHNVALTLASATFQVAIAVSSAAAVRVGHAVGAGDAPRARRAGHAAMVVITAFMGTTGLLFVLAPRLCAGVVTSDPQVIDAASSLLVVAAAFQLADGLQAVGAGALRGAGVTRYTFVANLVAHYAIGLPLGVALGFGAAWGATGLWWGLCAGLVAVAAALVFRFRAVTRGEIARA